MNNIKTFVNVYYKGATYILHSVDDLHMHISSLSQ